MKHKGIELKEITTPQVFDPPKEMFVWTTFDDTPKKRDVCAIVKYKNGDTVAITDPDNRWFHRRWNGIRWSLHREQMRKYDIVMDFATNFINQQRPLPDDDMKILEENLWSLV